MNKYFEIDYCIYCTDTTPFIEGATVLTEEQALELLTIQKPDYTWLFWSHETGLVRPQEQQEEQERDPENNGANCDEYLLESSQI